MLSICREFHLSDVECIPALSIFVLATVTSHLTGPLSELYDRASLMHVTNIWFPVLNVACGFAKNGTTLVSAHSFAGVGAGAIYSIFTDVMVNLWLPEERGTIDSLYLLVPFLGAAIASLTSTSGVVAH